MPLLGLGRRRRYAIGNPNAGGNGNALTASGARIRQREAEQVRRLVQPWQSRSFNYYDALGEIKYASQFYSRMLSPLRLFAAELDDDGDWVETEDPDAVEALERIQDPGGGRTGLLASYGRLMFLTGECMLFVSTDHDTGHEQWEVLSTDELRVQSGSYLRYKAPSMQVEEYRESHDGDEAEGAWVPVDDKTAVAYRLWQRHPRYSMLADSTMQGVLDLCEELLLLTQAVRARCRSRLAGSGILLIDERISPPPLEPGADEDPDADPFIRALTMAMTEPIVDEGAASQVVPLTLRVPVPEGGRVSDLMFHLQIVDPIQLYPETGLRKECIDRIAIGLDMPAEVLTGMGDLNHWGSWQVDEQTWKGHGQPKATQLVDDLTASYFRPYLREVVGKADWQRFKIDYDATAIINHPDRTTDAKDLYDKRAIGKKALREAAGFDEEDAPDEEERAEMVGIATRDSSLAWFGTPAPRGGTVETSPGEITDGSTGQGAVSPPNNANGPSGVKPGPPPAGPHTADEALTAAVVARVSGAADLALLRAREAAGNRLRSLAKRDPECLALCQGVRSGEIAAVLGRTNLRKINAPSERELVADSFDLIQRAMAVWGIDPDVAAKVATQVEQHAARTLYDRDPAPLPASFPHYLSGLISTRA